MRRMSSAACDSSARSSGLRRASCVSNQAMLLACAAVAGIALTCSVVFGKHIDEWTELAGHSESERANAPSNECDAGISNGWLPTGGQAHEPNNERRRMR